MSSTNNFYSKSIKSIEDVSPLIQNLTTNIRQSKEFLQHEKKNEQARVVQLLEEGANIFQKSLNPLFVFNPVRRDASMESHSSNSSSSTSNSKEHPTRPSDDDDKYPLAEMEGYLFKRSSGARKTWARYDLLSSPVSSDHCF
jgi:hypothetical protein